MQKNIICFLTVTPCILFYEFCKKLQNERYDIYICIDDNNYNIPFSDNQIKIIKIDNKLCEKNGFKGSVFWCDGDKCCSRDKALYYFCKNNIDYKYIWFLEEDVYIPSIDTIENIDKKYSDSDCDLLVKSNDIFYEKQSDYWFWNYVNKYIQIKPPYASSMICAIRCSKKLLNCINDYAKKYNRLFLDETLFNTIAFKNDLVVKTIEELETIESRNSWKWKKEEFKQQNLYHPIKSVFLHYYFRL